jgi:hypothetical protein
MSSVVQVLRSNIGLSSTELESRIRTLFPRNNCTGILQKENVIISGKPMVIRRLFIQTIDSGEYGNVGWVLNTDLENCMICAQEFSVFLTKQHCHGCGNLVCSVCSNEEATVYELEEMGPLRVCNQCFWGQEPVYARYTRLEDSMLEDATRRWSTDYPSPVPPSAVTAVAAAPETKLSKMTFLQQSTSDDEEDEEITQQHRVSQKMLIRKSTDEPVTHIPMFSKSDSKPSPNDLDELPTSNIPFIKRESAGSTTTLVELFPFRDSNGAQVESDHSDNSDTEDSPPLPQLTSIPSAWSATTIFSSLMNPKPVEHEAPQPQSAANSVESSNSAPVATTLPPPVPPTETTSRQSASSASDRLSSSSTSPPEPVTVSLNGNGNGSKSSPLYAPIAHVPTKTVVSKSPSPLPPSAPAASAPAVSGTLTQTQIPNFESRPVSQRIPFSNISTSSPSPPPSPSPSPRTPNADLSLRPLPPVTPSPFTVLKTKRLSDNSKVFINVLTIPEIYLDVTLPHLFFIHSLHQTEDKGGESCDVFDVCSSDFILNLTDTQDISEKYIAMIQKVNLDYHETLEIDYKTPKIKGNYKGNHGSEDIQPFHCDKLVSISEIQKDPKLFYLISEMNLSSSSASSATSPSASGLEASSSADTGAGVNGRPTSKKLNTSLSSAAAGAGAGGSAPPVMKGWMKKQGHQFKTIKRRYFVLEEGDLKYYEKPLENPPYGEKLKGSFPLKDGTVEFGTGDGKPLGRDGNQRLYLQALVCPSSLLHSFPFLSLPPFCLSLHLTPLCSSALPLLCWSRAMI